MNKKIFLLLSLGWFIAGCAGQTEDDPPGPMGPIATEECEELAISTCDGTGQSPVVEIDLDMKTIKPECVKAKRGRAIVFTVKSNTSVAKKSVEIFPKDPKNDWWLAGENTPSPYTILVLAPPKTKDKKSDFPTGYYGYGVKAPKWCVDPRIEVIP